jgi:hypothetical protein
MMRNPQATYQLQLDTSQMDRSYIILAIERAKEMKPTWNF